MTQAEFNAWIRARFNLWTKSDVDAEVRKAVEQVLAQRTWVDLTRTQMQDVYFEVLKEYRGGHQMEGQLAFGEALQAKLKERNT